MMTGCPVDLLIASPIARPITSVPLPAVNGTIMWIGFDG
jgi:hypothetical protein